MNVGIPGDNLLSTELHGINKWESWSLSGSTGSTQLAQWSSFLCLIHLNSLCLILLAFLFDVYKKRWEILYTGILTEVKKYFYWMLAWVLILCLKRKHKKRQNIPTPLYLTQHPPLSLCWSLWSLGCHSRKILSSFLLSQVSCMNSCLSEISSF